jgi:hypothetical protein
MAHTRTGKIMIPTPNIDGNQVVFDFPAMPAGLELLRDRRLLIARSGANLKKVRLNTREFNTIKLRFVPNGRIVPARVFTLDVTQLNEGEVMGGQRFYMKTGPRKGQVLWDRALGTFDGVVWTLHREKCNCR